MKSLSRVVERSLHSAISHLLDELLDGYNKQDFQLRLWDGQKWGKGDDPRFTLVLKHPDVLRKLFSSPDQLTLGEAYVSGNFDVEGDIEAAFELGDFLLSRNGHLGAAQAMGLAALEKLSSAKETASNNQTCTLKGPVHSQLRDRQAVQYHYDFPPEFFALWLDPQMIYSEGYFSDGVGVDEAQERKLEYVCRKLRLQRGEHLLDIGCGWGGLIMYAAKHFGVDAFGITLSSRQAETARARIHEEGLEKHCRVELCDYRELEPSRPFEKIGSIGMFEHVGEARLPEYFDRAYSLLAPGGAFLNSGIASVPHHGHGGRSFIDRYVFPDGELVPLGTTIRAAEGSGFEVRDVEELREHYAMTCREWVRRLEAHAEEAKRLTDVATYRIWRLYMAGSAHQFRTGDLNLFQILLAKPVHGESGMPLTREDWYRSGTPGTRKNGHGLKLAA